MPQPDPFKDVGRRIERSLIKRVASSIFGLQYRLGEVGRSRTNPILLERFLKEHRNPSSLYVVERSFVEQFPGIYVSRELSHERAKMAAERCRSSLNRLCAQDWPTSFRLIKETLLAEAKASQVLETTQLERLSGNTTLTVFAQILTSEWITGDRTVVWLSHDSSWIFPHDSRLWKALEAGRHLRLPVLVIARQIAPPTFVLLRALGAHGVQYYSSIVADDHEPLARQEADAAGWFHVRGASSLKSHPVRIQIANGLTRLAAINRSQVIDDSLSLGNQRGLANASSTLSEMLRWAVDAAELGLDIPPRLLDTLETWRKWQTDDPTTAAVAKPKADFGRLTEATKIGVRA